MKAPSFAKFQLTPWIKVIEDYHRSHGHFPDTAEDIDLPPVDERPDYMSFELMDKGEILIRFGTLCTELEGKSVIVNPRATTESYAWHCEGEALAKTDCPF